jgi:hypothetical protein
MGLIAIFFVWQATAPFLKRRAPQAATGMAQAPKPLTEA